eukprot:CAMPEP_0201710002 /NCGR_PEP_ID=MMETSP0578-20130828/58399_1 /ASSEMBLY_ACC=CAM_ASM_000663 /TAXON_ID=267565 /ORGANISM="Skeletonema grethea, Strain CCMP 1804" /LENGTH=270 /DNA_ID=CAMNT_0048199005 /DNA_START=213 /DNA_END=1025 /DNA_ORIENTATION=-
MTSNNVDDVTAITSEASKLIMDIPPTPIAPQKKAPAPKKKANAAHKEGIFSPIVVAASTILGQDQLNKVRAKAISIHSDLIKSFVGTSDSEFGQGVLQTAITSEASKLIMDIPPTPVAPQKKSPAPKKKANAAHKEGIFSPIVVAASTILGQDELNKVRAKAISIHSDLIKSFVGTSDSEFGQGVLQQLFRYVDADNSGYIDKEELSVALSMLGFKWLKDKQVNGIFKRADANGDGIISLEEFLEEAPRTLKTNLVKLAKNNGGDMGLLV